MKSKFMEVLESAIGCVLEVLLAFEPILYAMAVIQYYRRVGLSTVELIWQVAEACVALFHYIINCNLHSREIKR